MQKRAGIQTAGTQKRRLALAAVTGGALGVAFVLGSLMSGSDSFHTAGHAEWLSLRRGPALVVSGFSHQSPESGPSHDSHGFAVVDAATGKLLSREWYGDSYDFASSPNAPTMLTAGGARIAYRLKGALHLRDADSNEDLSGAALEARFRDIAAPWHQFRVVGPGQLAIESDDKRWWQLDLATGTLAPSTPPQRSNDYRSCAALDWPRASGKIWTFMKLPTERHSDSNRYGLVEARRLTWDKLDDVVPLGLRVAYAHFVCDERSGRTAELEGGGTLISQWLLPDQRVAISLLDGQGKLAWTWPSPVLHHANCAIEAFTYAGGVIVRIDTTLTSLDGRGQVRWATRL
jgi:hypothetical protein